MSSDQLGAWLRLSQVKGLGPVKIARLAGRFGICTIAGAGLQQLCAMGLSEDQARQALDHDSISDSLRWLEQSDTHHILTPDDERYPSLLREVPAAPPVLYVKGEPAVLSQPQIALVGSRHATPDGLQNAFSFSRDLAGRGLTITSGLALGVDGRAHRGALEADGFTIGVLGCGLGRVYPARHKSLAEQVAASGALVSELPPSTPPKATFFPRRNRIISGLSAGVLVVEAAEKSGSLITARFALEQGREVFALPGPLHSPQSRGSNRLIREGATLVQSSQQILDEVESLLTWSISQQTSIFESEAEPEQLPFPQLLANVGFEATPVDILAQRTHIPVHEVMTQLLELELAGHVVAVPGGYIRKGRG